MYWEIDEPDEPEAATAVDIAFPLRGRALPEAYAAPLAEAVAPLLADIIDPEAVGARVTHIPESGHGWQRTPGQPILLTRRTRLVLRVGREVAGAIGRLNGAQLRVGGETLGLGDPQHYELPAAETVYAHRVLGLGAEDEATLLAEAKGRLAASGIYPRRMLCGRAEDLAVPGGWRVTRSLLVDGMGAGAGRRLQAEGLGEGRCWGCGLFIPHKAVT